MSESVRNGDLSNIGYKILKSLVFLHRDDYERLDNEGKKFIFHKNVKDHRSPFERDRARIIHSPFFRSLGGKCQVFGPNQSDFFRTRLTHSLEVAQIAKVMTVEICENYRKFISDPPLSPWEQGHLCELVEAVSLAHDLGHPPFGHIGEEALNKKMKEYGESGFEANAQTLRILTKLDKAYPGRTGFTRGVLSGIMKYKIKTSVGFSKFIYDDDWFIVEMSCPWWKHDEILNRVGKSQKFNYEVRKSRTLVCQIMDLADEITYAGHDIEDILYTPLLRYGNIEGIRTLSDQYTDEILHQIQLEVEYNSSLPINKDLIQNGWETLQSSLLNVLKSTNLSNFKIRAHRLRRQHMNEASASCKAIKSECGKWDVKISQKSALRSALIRSIVVPIVHHDSKLVTLQRKGTRVLHAIFDELMDGGNELLSSDFRDKFNSATESYEQARIYCDFIAGMTEQYAFRFYQRLFESDRDVLTDFF